MLISIEGVDFAGKTTQIELLKKYAEKHSKNWVFTRNPGGSELGKQLRDILLHSEEEHISQQAELMIYLADRAHHVDSFIKPALKESQIIICDRFIDSTVAYQGYGRGMDIGLIKQMNTLVCDGIKPHLTILLTVSEGVANERSKAREKDRLEKENKLFFIRVRNGYMTLAKQEPLRFNVIDTDLMSPEEIHEQMVAVIDKAIEQFNEDLKKRELVK